MEGIIGKRPDSLYEIGKRSGSWVKHRVNIGQQLVIGGYTKGGHFFDALVVGYYGGSKLRFTAKIRNGFSRVDRQDISAKMPKLLTEKCLFVNLPEKLSGRWVRA
jgi:bifunctional non-homologous end joining protein LigD